MFSSDGGHTSIGNFSKMKSKLQLLSNSASWTYHDFRRSLASHLKFEGSRHEIQCVLNHSDNSVTAVYDRSDHFAVKLKCLKIGQSKLIDRKI